MLHTCFDADQRPLTFADCNHLVIPLVTATNSDCYIMKVAVLIYNNKTQSQQKLQTFRSHISKFLLSPSSSSIHDAHNKACSDLMYSFHLFHNLHKF